MWNGEWDEGDEVRVKIEVFQLCYCVGWDEEVNFVASLSKSVGDMEKGD